MNDLISRQAAIDAIAELQGRAYTKAELKGISKAWKRIKQLPSAEPKRKKGMWVPHRERSREYIGTALVSINYDYWFCDTCGYWVEDGQPLYNFCPNCGADMRKDDPSHPFADSVMMRGEDDDTD